MKLTVNTNALNARVRPGTFSPIVDRLSRGTEVERLGAERFESGYTWLPVIVPATGTVAWVAKEFLSDGSGPIVIPPPPPPPPGKAKIGFHIAGGHPPGNIIEIIQDMHNSGKPLPLILIVNHGWLCKEVKRVSPSTTVVYRPVLWDDNDNPYTRGWVSGEWWMNRMWEHIAPYRQWFDYTQLDNEWYVIPSRSTADMVPFNNFNVQLMQAANQRGIKILVGNIAVGNLDTWHEPALDGMFKFAAQYGHPFDYHMYGSQEVNHSMLDRADLYAARWHRWAKKYPNLKFIFGEMGSFHGPRFVNADTTIRQMKESMQLIAPYANQVIGGAWWTLAGEPGGWGPDDFAPAVPAVVQYMKSV